MHSRHVLSFSRLQTEDRTAQGVAEQAHACHGAPVHIRFLNGDDAPAFRLLRLEALRELPEGFGASYAEVRDEPWAAFDHSFRSEWTSGDNVILGAFQGPRLVGAVGLRRWTREKQRHKGYIWILFVEPGTRGRGTGRRLLGAAIAYARDLEGLQQIQLSVSEDGQAARSLYVACGFEPFGCERNALRIHDRFVDLQLMALHLGPDSR